MNLNNISISRKLWGAILILLIAMLAIGGLVIQYFVNQFLFS